MSNIPNIKGDKTEFVSVLTSIINQLVDYINPLQAWLESMFGSKLNNSAENTDVPLAITEDIFTNPSDPTNYSLNNTPGLIGHYYSITENNGAVQLSDIVVGATGNLAYKFDINFGLYEVTDWVTDYKDKIELAINDTDNIFENASSFFNVGSRHLSSVRYNTYTKYIIFDNSTGAILAEQDILDIDESIAENPDNIYNFVAPRDANMEPIEGQITFSAKTYSSSGQRYKIIHVDLFQATFSTLLQLDFPGSYISDKLAYSLEDNWYMIDGKLYALDTQTELVNFSVDMPQVSPNDVPGFKHDNHFYVLGYANNENDCFAQKINLTTKVVSNLNIPSSYYLNAEYLGVQFYGHDIETNIILVGRYANNYSNYYIEAWDLEGNVLPPGTEGRDVTNIRALLAGEEDATLFIKCFYDHNPESLMVMNQSNHDVNPHLYNIYSLKNIDTPVAQYQKTETYVFGKTSSSDPNRVVRNKEGGGGGSGSGGSFSYTTDLAFQNWLDNRTGDAITAASFGSFINASSPLKPTSMWIGTSTEYNALQTSFKNDSTIAFLIINASA